MNTELDALPLTVSSICLNRTPYSNQLARDHSTKFDINWHASSFSMAHKVQIHFKLHTNSQLDLAVFLYCHQVVQALWELGIQVASWGDDECHQETSEYVMDVYGFLDCVGMLDGTLIHLTQMPDDNAFSFICHKKFPAINIQAIVDHKMWFISVDLGWPGSVSDVTMWKKLHVWHHRQDYF
ncbi:hypothetical protein BDR04DRAFT_1204618 [Suillus decipiens]|nr:hypothetical protein BDR04DRAFT_1204618 [Suillus decipiens]